MLCDADVDAPIVQHLRDAGHEVLYLAEIQPRADDDQVLELANQKEAVLIRRDNATRGSARWYFDRGFRSTESF